MYINEKSVDSWISVFNIQLNALRIVSYVGLLINVDNNWLFQYLGDNCRVSASN